MAEVAQSPKTGEIITVKRHGFGENRRQNTPKTAPNSQISKCSKTIFIEIALKRAGAGRSGLTIFEHAMQYLDAAGWLD